MKKQKANEKKGVFLNRLWAVLGGRYTISIPLFTFANVNPEKLYATINYMFENNKIEDIEESEFVSVDSKSETTKNTGIITTLFKAFLVSLFIGFIYGVSIYLFKINILLIPFLSLLWMLYTYQKSSNKNKNFFLIKIVFGLICSIQLLIAPLILMLFQNKEAFKMFGITEIVTGCIRYMFENPIDFLRFYVFALIFFIIGVTSGISMRFFRLIRRMFLKKSNGYYIVRKKCYVSIYITDYADFNDNDEKNIIDIGPNICLIDTEGKRVNSFYIPVDLFKEVGITANSFAKVTINEIDYNHISLGGQSYIRTYGCHCTLITNKANKLEVIKIKV